MISKIFSLFVLLPFPVVSGTTKIRTREIIFTETKPMTKRKLAKKLHDTYNRCDSNLQTILVKSLIRTLL